MAEGRKDGWRAMSMAEGYYMLLLRCNGKTFYSEINIHQYKTTYKDYDL